MGNAAIRDIAVIESVAMRSLGGAVVAVDAHNWLYKYLTTTVKFTRPDAYTSSDGEEVPNLIGVVQGIPKFLEANITPVFVFDGSPTDLKADEIAARREQRATTEERLAAARERGDPIEIARLESRVQQLTPVIHETTRDLLRRLDVPIIEAPAEGEAQASAMARHDPQVDFAGSDDYDTLLFGAPYTLRQLTSAGDPEVMDLEATLDTHDITWEQLVDAGILTGTDFNEGITGIGPITAIDAVKEHGDLWGVLEARGVDIEHADRIRSLFLEPQTTMDYEIDRSIDPDLERARSFVTDTWGIPLEEVARGFDRIESAVRQTGLDRFG